MVALCPGPPKPRVAPAPLASANDWSVSACFRRSVLVRRRRSLFDSTRGRGSLVGARESIWPVGDASEGAKVAKIASRSDVETLIFGEFDYSAGRLGSAGEEEVVGDEEPLGWCVLYSPTPTEKHPAGFQPCNPPPPPRIPFISITQH